MLKLFVVIRHVFTFEILQCNRFSSIQTFKLFYKYILSKFIVTYAYILYGITYKVKEIITYILYGITYKINEIIALYSTRITIMSSTA